MTHEKQTSKAMKKYPKKPEAVYYFGTCLVDLLYPEAGLAGIRLLQREGVKVFFPQEQTCCGQPAFNSGFHDEARKVASLQVKLFPEDIPIVIPSGSCGGMIRKHYAKLFKNDKLVYNDCGFIAKTSKGKVIATQIISGHKTKFEGGRHLRRVKKI